MIEVNNLSKSFGLIRAVDSVSFAVNKGDVLGFLGPNGAGKSTTMRILSCFIAPDSGTASIAGHDIISDSVEARKKLGYVAENAPAYDEMTVDGFLRFICATREIAKTEMDSAIERVSQQTAIEGVKYQQIGTLSKGFKRRVGLAQALVHNPPVLILDEPTDGLDPNQKYDVRQLITSLAKDKCIIISTHILEEVEALCNRLIIINEGRIVTDTTPSALREEEGGSLEEIFRKLTTSDRLAVSEAGGVQ